MNINQIETGLNTSNDYALLANDALLIGQEALDAAEAKLRETAQGSEQFNAALGHLEQARATLGEVAVAIPAASTCLDGLVNRLSGRGISNPVQPGMRSNLEVNQSDPTDINTYVPQIDKIWKEIDDGKQPSDVKGYLAGGHTMRTYVVDGQPNTLIKVPAGEYGEDTDLMQDYVVPLQRCQGESGFEQMLGYRQPDQRSKGAIAVSRVPGIPVTNLADNPIEIPDKHFDKLLNDTRKMERLSVQSAGNADDLFYDAKQGFTFVDVDPAYNDPDHGTAVSKTALNIGDTVGLLCASAIGHRSFSPGYAHGLVAAIERRYGDEGLEAVRKALFTLHITPNVSLDYRQKATLDIYAILSGQN